MFLNYSQYFAWETSVTHFVSVVSDWPHLKWEMQHICLIQSVLIKQNICNKFNSIQDYDQQSIFAHIYLNLHTFIEISREQNTQEDLGLKLHLDFHF